MKTQNVGIRARLIAGAMAGVLTFGFSGLPGLVAVANAQPKKPAAAPAPATKKPTAAAKPAATGGDADLKKARDAYANGEAKFKGGDYAGALTEFQTADAIKPSPQAARYIGLCQDNLGKFPDAVASYDRFLTNVPAKLQKEGEEITKRVEQIKVMPARIHVVSVPPGASIAVDTKPSMAVAPTDVELTPGKHTLHFAADGRLPQDKDVDVQYAARQDLRVELEKKPEAPPAAPVAVATVPVTPEPTTTSPPTSLEPRSKVPAFITGGLAIAAAGVGTTFGILALSSRSDFNKTPTTDKADTGENQALIADMAFGVALTLGITSLVLFLSGDDDGPPSAKAGATGPTQVAAKKPVITFSAAPIVTTKGAGAGAVLRF